MSAEGFRDSFRRYIPSWLQNRPGKNVGYRFLWSMIFGLDLMMQASVEGVKAAWPGVGTPTALPLIGASRGLLQGETETDPHFAARLIPWIDTWEDCGSDEQLATQIQEYLGNTPEVRIVDRAGDWTILHSDGTFAYVDNVPLDWDSVSNPERASHWADLWIIVSPCEWPVTPPTLASLVGVWGTYTGSGVGHACGRVAVDAILGLVQLWKGGHEYVRAIVWTYDATKFNPAYPSELPDGTYGKWGKVSGTAYVPARDATCRYWEPVNG